MDLSKIYIKMCEEAREIQKPISKLKDGDFITDWRFKENEVIVYSSLMHDVGFGEEGPDNEFTWWIPRQDQLQDMVRVKTETDAWLLRDFYIFVSNDKLLHNPMLYFSMEELWLIFVMRRKYQKIWNGKEWVK